MSFRSFMSKVTKRTVIHVILQITLHLTLHILSLGISFIIIELSCGIASMIFEAGRYLYNNRKKYKRIYE